MIILQMAAGGSQFEFLRLDTVIGRRRMGDGFDSCHVSILGWDCISTPVQAKLPEKYSRSIRSLCKRASVAEIFIRLGSSESTQPHRYRNLNVQ